MLVFHAGAGPLASDAREFSLLVAGQLAMRLALLASERESQLLLEVLEQTTDLVQVAIDPQHVSYRNRAARAALGVGAEVPPPLQPGPLALHPAETHDALRAAAEHARRDGRWTGETEVVAADGTRFPVTQVLIAHRGPLGEVRAFSTIMRDVREEREQAAQLAERERRFDSVLQGLREGVVLQDASGRILLWNAAAERILGLDADQLAGRSSFDPRWRAVRSSTGQPLDGTEHAAMRALASGETITDRDMTIHRPDDSAVRLHVTSVPLVRDGDVHPYAVVSTFTDVTEAARLDAALRASEARFRSLVAHAMDGIIAVTPDSEIVLINEAAARMFGARADELVGQALDVLLPARYGAAHREHLRAFAAHGATTRGMGRPGEVMGRRADGTEFPIEATISRSPDDPAGLVSVILRDVTEQRLLERQLRQAQKMEAVGQLAGGIAHDFNNLLTIVQSASEFLREDLPTDDPRLGDVRLISDATDRARTLTMQLLSFTRQRVEQLQVLAVDAVIAQVLSLLRRLLPPRVRLRDALAAGPATARLDQGQLDLVLMNLVANARDAIVEEGEVLLTTRRRTLALDEALALGLPAGGAYVEIDVADTGVGMSEETQSHLFEPFFTTKAVGKGTGLGLATVYGIVRQHGGVIQCTSRIGEGTRFRVLIPVVEAPPPSRPIISESAPGPEDPGRFTVLVVDDEAGVRSVVSRTLTRAGYRLLEAASGEEALALLAAHAAPDLILTDFMMPGISGRELLERARSLAPAPASVLMSGFTRDEITRQSLQHTTTRFLQKPFSADTLLAAVADALSDSTKRQA